MRSPALTDVIRRGRLLEGVRTQRRALLVALLAGLAHVESLSYWFTSSDTLPLIESSRVTATGDFIGLFARPLMAGTRFTGVALFYRPVASLSYALDYWLWGLSPVGYHLTNLALHAAAAVLVAVAVAAVTDRPAAGWLAAAGFALHPMTAEVVPTAARRHDVLVAVFVLAALTLFVRSRARGSRRALAGALGAYALALGVKETALFFPGLVVAWVAIRRLPARPLAAAREALWAAVPFALVTAAYLAVRAAVLGGLGGYRTPRPLTPLDAFLVPVKYLLSVTYPADVIGVGAAAVPAGWLLVSLPAGAAALLALARRGSLPDGAGVRTLPLVGALAALGAIPALLALAPGVADGLPYVLGYPYRTSPLVGLLFVGGCALGLLWAGLARDARLALRDARALAFFGAWFLLPLPLFLAAGAYSVRSGYAFSIPVLGGLSLLAVTAWRALASGGGRGTAANAALLALLALLVLPTLLVTPLAHSYDGWRASGEINRLTLGAIERELGAVEADRVVVAGLPTGIHEQREAFPRVKSIGYTTPNTIEAWLRLRGGDAPRVKPTDPVVLARVPERVDAETTTADGTIRVHLRYE